LQLQGLTELVIDRCFSRDLTPLSAASRLVSLHLSYDCWAIMGVSFPMVLPALQKLRLMAALQVGGRAMVVLGIHIVMWLVQQMVYLLGSHGRVLPCGPASPAKASTDGSFAGR
jgi:hypothetical protein